MIEPVVMRRLVVLLALPVIFLAQTPRNKANLLPNEQWVSLFNGKDLTGWIKVGAENWTVEDGTIHGQGVTKQYGYLMTEKDYKDFWLSLRFKCEADGNSGVYFHTRFKPGTVDVVLRGCSSKSTAPRITITVGCMATAATGSRGLPRNSST